MKISIIAAVSENGVIGKEGKIPWHLPNDFKSFKRITSSGGRVVIMGRKTHESIGKALPERVNIVVTRQKGYQSKGCLIVSSLEETFKEAENLAGDGEVFVIGGEEIYRQAFAKANKIYLTRVNAVCEGAARFPLEELENGKWKCVSALLYPKDEKHEFSYSFCVYERS